MNIFVKDNDVIKIPVCICPSKKDRSSLYIDTTKEELEKQENDDINFEDMKTNNVYFRFPNYADSTKILEDSVFSNGEEVKINVSAARRVKLTTLLRDWDFVDDNGDKIEANTDNLYKMNPIVANFLANKLDEVV